MDHASQTAVMLLAIAPYGGCTLHHLITASNVLNPAAGRSTSSPGTPSPMTSHELTKPPSQPESRQLPPQESAEVVSEPDEQQLRRAQLAALSFAIACSSKVLLLGSSSGGTVQVPFTIVTELLPRATRLLREMAPSIVLPEPCQLSVLHSPGEARFDFAASAAALRAVLLQHLLDPTVLSVPANDAQLLICEPFDPKRGGGSVDAIIGLFARTQLMPNGRASAPFVAHEWAKQRSRALKLENHLIEFVATIREHLFPSFTPPQREIQRRLADPDLIFARRQCERALAFGKNVYLDSLPAVYHEDVHRSQSKKAVRAYLLNACVGPYQASCLQTLTESCLAVWQNGRMACSAVSVAGLRCENPAAAADSPAHQHSAYPLSGLCPCGMTKCLPASQYQLEDANMYGAEADCCRQLVQFRPSLVQQISKSSDVPNPRKQQHELSPSKVGIFIASAKRYKRKNGLPSPPFAEDGRFLKEWDVYATGSKSGLGTSQKAARDDAWQVTQVDALGGVAWPSPQESSQSKASARVLIGIAYEDQAATCHARCIPIVCKSDPAPSSSHVSLDVGSIPIFRPCSDCSHNAQSQLSHLFVVTPGAAFRTFLKLAVKFRVRSTTASPKAGPAPESLFEFALGGLEALELPADSFISIRFPRHYVTAQGVWMPIPTFINPDSAVPFRSSRPDCAFAFVGAELQPGFLSVTHSTS
ncbi:hypothetical protein CAOG_06693 [Capsaspora owczarzaki ATCC 30864]|uniref:Nonsense-mediated mRNA decay factor SMG8 n=1 Tax=Capsaspora owczarzaki (strain ATCC 30864) TaxID=595528 RepID=A0A0D2WUI0_CAPO3|nr:hypothetical protein CAOG_06693 [Capsaspora owczarzaki ATCC 30864]KJE96355.1 hypothetical protein CAOG_006693 [Capsaspora owczarzaki ATCC 30864]|eukprot:XP_004344314.2 hypothetical protein CAOG_06693 [Capsaspora owczarzaki ATCC 30864]